jgi:hypothetical protein
MKLSRVMSCLAFLGTLALIVYFTFRDSSKVSEISWMPKRWGLWLDEHDEFRHFIGFAVFAATAFLIDLDTFFNRSRSKFVRRFRSSRNRTGRLGALLVLVYALELGQINMPHRDFDWLDIVNGWAGILTAWAVWFAWKAHQRRRRRISHERRHMPINISSVRFR